MANDPVCGMTFDEKKILWCSDYNGQTYHFCTANCKRWFDKDPERYVKKDDTRPKSIESGESPGQGANPNER